MSYEKGVCLLKFSWLGPYPTILFYFIMLSIVTIWYGSRYLTNTVWSNKTFKISAKLLNNEKRIWKLAQKCHLEVVFWCFHNVVLTLSKLPDMYNVSTTFFCNVVCTLQHNVVLYIVATSLAHLFHNVVKITFLQRCTTLYLHCVFAGRVTLTLTLTLLMLYIAHFKHLINRKSHFLCKTSKKRNILVNGNFRENIYKILNFRYFFSII